MVARLLRMQKAWGSTPHISTKHNGSALQGLGRFLFLMIVTFALGNQKGYLHRQIPFLIIPDNRNSAEEQSSLSKPDTYCLPLL